MKVMNQWKIFTIDWNKQPVIDYYTDCIKHSNSNSHP